MVKQVRLFFIVVVLGSFLAYFLLHSIFWWKGLFGSLGLHRVMAGIAPVFSLIALLVINFIQSLLAQRKNLQNVLLIVIIVAVIVYPFKQYRMPLQPSSEMEVCDETALWIKTENLTITF